MDAVLNFGLEHNEDDYIEINSKTRCNYYR